MKRMIAVVLMIGLAVALAPRADAMICVPRWLEFDECHPKDGSEPAEWCGNGAGRAGQIFGKIRFEAEKLLGRAVDLLD